MQPAPIDSPFQALILDDNVDATDVSAGMQDCCPITGGNEMDALPASMSLLPDLILLDISLLDMDAYEVPRQLRADSLTVEVILLGLNG